MDRLGRDTLHREGPRLVVQSPARMPEWRASAFRRTEVICEGRRFFVAGVSRNPDGRQRYVLEPWPADLSDRPGRTIVYDEEYVRLRDTGRSRAWVALLLWPALVCANPAFGCLWDRTKRQLQKRIGLDPRSATLQALLCQYLLVLLGGVVTWVVAFGAIPVPGLTWPRVLTLTLVLLLDAVMRYNHLQDHPEDFLGVGEWLARFQR